MQVHTTEHEVTIQITGKPGEFAELYEELTKWNSASRSEAYKVLVSEVRRASGSYAVGEDV